MTTYNAGTSVRLEGIFKDSDENIVEPANVYFVLYGPNPTGPSGTYQYGVDVEVKRLSSGTYYMDIIVQDGFYIYKSYSISSPQAMSDEGEFLVV